MDQKSKCLVVLSGGQDSTTCGWWAKQHFDEVYCLTIDYGQRHSREIQSAMQIGKLLGAKQHWLVPLDSILQGSSPLTNHDAELEKYSDFETMDKIIGDRVELTFVPMRNAIFLSIAANFAVANGIRNLVTGVCQEDNANYPDCRLNFIQAQETTINLALGINDFRIHTPLMRLRKAESVKMLERMGAREFASLAFSHTAYDGTYPPVGNDHASILRAHGFEEADVPDPLVIRAFSEALMHWPTTHNYDHRRLRIAAIIAGVSDEVIRIKKELGL